MLPGPPEAVRRPQKRAVTTHSGSKLVNHVPMERGINHTVRRRGGGAPRLLTRQVEGRKRRRLYGIRPQGVGAEAGKPVQRRATTAPPNSTQGRRQEPCGSRADVGALPENGLTVECGQENADLRAPPWAHLPLLFPLFVFIYLSLTRTHTCTHTVAIVGNGRRGDVRATRSPRFARSLENVCTKNVCVHTFFANVLIGSGAFAGHWVL